MGDKKEKNRAHETTDMSGFELSRGPEEARRSSSGDDGGGGVVVVGVMSDDLSRVGACSVPSQLILVNLSPRTRSARFWCLGGTVVGNHVYGVVICSLYTSKNPM